MKQYLNVLEGPYFVTFYKKSTEQKITIISVQKCIKVLLTTVALIQGIEFSEFPC